MNTNEGTKSDWRTLIYALYPLLVLTLAGQFALTIFEGTFALFAQAKFTSVRTKWVTSLSCAGS